MTRGTVNLANDWVYGLSNFPRAVLGTLGGTLAHVSLNEEYIKQHAADASAAEAGDVLEGLGLGGRHLLRGAWQGVTGVVADPIQGWERDGFVGFFKGVSKALIGAVVKPAVGLSDFTTKVRYFAACPARARAARRRDSGRIVTGNARPLSHAPPFSMLLLGPGHQAI